MTDDTLNQELAERLSGLRKDGGSAVPREEIARVVDGIMTSMRGDLSGVDLKLYSELEALAEYIQHAKLEIAALRPDEIKDRIPSATDELDAVVFATEQATNTIMDSVEEIENLIPNMDEEVGKSVQASTTAVYEACNFQDITGQRITKVVKTLQHIENKVEALLQAFGEEIKRNDPTAVVEKPKPENSEEDLLNGPQMPDEANRQADIDALLASFD